jgi:glycosyltransferase involved in cell wall biosynthesis
MKPYEQLFRYVWHFNVGIIPFKLNRITQATTSIKLFEYMACGVPVISTAMPESRRYPGVFIAENADDFVRQIDLALTAGQDPSYLELIDQVAHQHSWEERVEAVISSLEKS